MKALVTHVVGSNQFPDLWVPNSDEQGVIFMIFRQKIIIPVLHLNISAPYDGLLVNRIQISPVFGPFHLVGTSPDQDMSKGFQVIWV